MENLFNEQQIPDFYFNQYFHLTLDLLYQLDPFLYNNLTLDLWDLKLALKINANEEYIK
jgi:hypothetical protein